MIRSEIINLWKSIGWNSIKEYHNSCIYEPPIIEDLDPDKVSPVEFWYAAQNHFLTDPISNSRNSSSTFNVSQSNTLNHNLAVHLGMIGQLEMAIADTKYKFGKTSIAEIGCGYGSLYKSYIKSKNIDYIGFDLIKRFKLAIPVKGKNGTLSPYQIKKYKDRFNIFYSANVFQHLSPTQIKTYLMQIYDILPYGGYANIMYIHGTEFTYHYGQKINIINENSFIDLVKFFGYNVISLTKSYVGDIKPFSLLLEK